jgi:hypothetical protein
MLLNKQITIHPSNNERNLNTCQVRNLHLILHCHLLMLLIGKFIFQITDHKPSSLSRSQSVDLSREKLKQGQMKAVFEEYNKSKKLTLSLTNVADWLVYFSNKQITNHPPCHDRNLWTCQERNSNRVR